jgi:hypothetical protein
MSSPYPMWKFYPGRARPPEWVHTLVGAFADARDGDEAHMISDQKLSRLRPVLIELGYDVEAGKKAADKLRRPVLFGELGHEDRAFEVDAFNGEHGVALEIKAGRGTQGNAIYRDLIQTSLLIDARFLALAVLIESPSSRAGRPSDRPTTARRSACSTRSTPAIDFDCRWRAC